MSKLLKVYNLTKILTVFCFFLPFLPHSCDRDNVELVDLKIDEEQRYEDVKNEVFRTFIYDTSNFQKINQRIEVVDLNSNLQKMDSIKTTDLIKHIDLNEKSTETNTDTGIFLKIYTYIVFTLYFDLIYPESGFDLIFIDHSLDIGIQILRLSFIFLFFGILNEKFLIIKFIKRNGFLYLLGLLCLLLFQINYMDKLLFGYWTTLLIYILLIIINIALELKNRLLTLAQK